MLLLVVLREKQVFLSYEFAIVRGDRKLPGPLDDLLAPKMWSASPEGFDDSNVGSVGLGT